MTREARSIRCPETVMGWIPWYGERGEDGKSLLDARQRGAVEAHASECADCRAELDMIAGAPYQIDVDLPDPERMFHEITARLDAGEAEGLDTAPNLPDRQPTPIALPRTQAPTKPAHGERRLTDAEMTRLADWVFEADPDGELLGDVLGQGGDLEREGVDSDALGSSDSATDASGNTVVVGPWARSKGWASVAAAAVFVFGMVGGAMLSGVAPLGASADLYESAAAEEAVSGPMIDVVFIDSANAAAIAEGLRAIGAEIVSGPSSVGRYRLSIDPAALSENNESADIAAITARLKAGPTPLALFAEPVLK